MLIDASHPEETRVVVLRGDRVEEFDYESANRKQLRGNIYLAKVTRVEPSLQAAFVDFGGNRHGFLAFSEIHPDYYQIPVADRQLLLDQEAEEQSRAEAEEDKELLHDFKQKKRSSASSSKLSAEDDVDSSENGGRYGEPENDEAVSGEHTKSNTIASARNDVGDSVVSDRIDPADNDQKPPFGQLGPENSLNVHDHNSDQEPAEPTRSAEQENSPSLATSYDPSYEKRESDDQSEEAGEQSETSEQPGDVDNKENRAQSSASEINDEYLSDGTQDQTLDESVDGEDGNDIESVGSEDILEEVPQRIRSRRKTYKIQEVIKRRQIILVQVVKEERGNKGAALTTYLSLAGRYTVLMPNTARGGGISRKITNPSDRKRIRKIAGDLDVPEGMGLIVRTAGAARTRAEIKRDYDYLLRLWENVRDLTLKSTAPALVYAEGDLIKRSIRDLYSKEIDEVKVAGEVAYKDAKDFMRMLMPSHAKNVKLYKEPEPLFVHHQIEHQLNAMFSPYVTLKSGGYIVINQTEALVAVDVNSGKATREHSIEDTALKTNQEAAEEVARQLRLRDLAGLIVIDFIDMEDRRNVRAVERRLKDCLKNDRARIQIGRISPFGLLEMSRQRLRTGMLEGSTTQCAYCQGTGVIRSTESVSLSVLRSIEDTLQSGNITNLRATTSVDVAIYILNHKRLYLKDIETRYGISIAIAASDTLQGANFTVEQGEAINEVSSDLSTAVQMDWSLESKESPAQQPSGEEGRKKSRRRKRRRRPPSETALEASQIEQSSSDNDENSETGTSKVSTGDEEKSTDRKSSARRRGRRGGRRRGGRTPDSEVPGIENSVDTKTVVESKADDSKLHQQSEPDIRIKNQVDNPSVLQTPDIGKDGEPISLNGERPADSDQQPETTSGIREAERKRRVRRRTSKSKSDSSVDTVTSDPPPLPTESSGENVAARTEHMQPSGDRDHVSTSPNGNDGEQLNNESASNRDLDITAHAKSERPRRGWWQKRP